MRVNRLTFDMSKLHEWRVGVVIVVECTPQQYRDNRTDLEKILNTTIATYLTSWEAKSRFIRAPRRFVNSVVIVADLEVR